MEGARVEKIEANYSKTCEHAREESKKDSWQLVQDTAWVGNEEIPAMIMAGNLMHFQELKPFLALIIIISSQHYRSLG